MDSSAPQDKRGMICGEPAIDSVRGGSASTGLHTKYARSRVTAPRNRYAIAFDALVQYGLPMRQPGCAGWSGPSSASGAAGSHRLQRPVSERVRNSTEPRPRQCSPTRSKRGGEADARARAPCNGTSRIVIVAPSARATAGVASRTATASRTGFMRATRSRVAKRGFALKVSRPSLIESLRVEDRLFAGIFARRRTPRACLPGFGGYAAHPRDPLRRRHGGQPRDAVVRQPRARRGAKGRLFGGRDLARHARRAVHVDAAHLPEGAG